ncbi:MAG TPA: hypothetical protein VNT50_08620 [Microbacterium sp.]|uniref:hypothetical protein n=1 Tax=Microbacterium sp. TaxID=51671 RepID=UPI002BAA6594|nr:hypothetical protein [Microbacterium sp.]HWI31543.1 hypothetical protein [Microbacterium sp.]
MSRTAWTRDVRVRGARIVSGIAIVSAIAFMLTACVGHAAHVPTPTSESDSQMDPAQRDALVQKCIGDAETGTIEAKTEDARVAQRDDGRWLVSVPMKYQALAYGEQHCVIVDAPGGLRRDGLDDGKAWPEGDFEKWLAADRLWWE